MLGVVVMPTCRRPEFLALSLEHLSGALIPFGFHDIFNSLDVRIYADVESNKSDTEYVRNKYYPSAVIYYATKRPDVPGGTWNILDSLKRGYEAKAKYVFLIEEDVMVNSYFFFTHLSLHLRDDYFVTCGRRAKNRPEGMYSNPGCCFKREKLALVVPHICDEYFKNPREYVDKYLPGMDLAGMLDDGLIQRVIWSTDGKVGYPEKPIAVHQGFRMYNKTEPYKTEGTIQERIEQLRAMLKRVDSTNHYTQDFESFEGRHDQSLSTKIAD